MSLTDRARKVLKLAEDQARGLNHEYIGTEHILLGLIAEGTGVGVHVLMNLGMDLGRIQDELKTIIVSNELNPVVLDTLPYTPRASSVFKSAEQEVRDLKHDSLGTEHLLLGLLHVPDGVACQVLNNLGVTLEGAREEVLNLLGRSPE